MSEESTSKVEEIKTPSGIALNDEKSANLLTGHYINIINLN